MTNETKNPHPHAELIHKWADGAQIQYYNVADVKWVDCPNNQPGWYEYHKYRIKPEGGLWKPKLHKRYYYATASGAVSNDTWDNDTTDNGLFEAGNCFSTSEEAEALAEQIRVVLRGERSEELKKLRQENEELKFRCENLHKAKEAAIKQAQECSSLSVPLSDGEAALIRAIRKTGVVSTWERNSAVLVYEAAGELVSRKDIVAFFTDGTDTDDDEVRAALDAISREQEAEQEDEDE